MNFSTENSRSELVSSRIMPVLMKEATKMDFITLEVCSD